MSCFEKLDVLSGRGISRGLKVLYGGLEGLLWIRIRTESGINGVLDPDPDPEGRKLGTHKKKFISFIDVLDVLF
jgi:hypothetical protein